MDAAKLFKQIQNKIDKKELSKQQQLEIREMLIEETKQESKNRNGRLYSSENYSQETLEKIQDYLTRMEETKKYLESLIATHSVYGNEGKNKTTGNDSGKKLPQTNLYASKTSKNASQDNSSLFAKHPSKMMMRIEQPQPQVQPISSRKPITKDHELYGVLLKKIKKASASTIYYKLKGASSYSLDVAHTFNSAFSLDADKEIEDDEEIDEEEKDEDDDNEDEDEVSSSSSEMFDIDNDNSDEFDDDIEDIEDIEDDIEDGLEDD